MIDNIYDVEVFKNFFCVTFYETHTQSVKTFSIAWEFGIDERQELFEYLNSEEWRLVSYNGLCYDYKVIDFIDNWKDGKNINTAIYKKSQEIINSGMFAATHRNFKWAQLDLMKMMAFDKLKVGLKQTSVNLKWHRVQDLPFEYDYKIKEEDIKTIINYNINDVLILYKLFLELQEEIQLRNELSKLYGVDLTNASDSKIANVLLEKFYFENMTKKEADKIKASRTKRDFLWLGECISDNISFKTKKLQGLKADLEKTLVVGENNFSYNKSLEFANCTYDLGIGGLHSRDKAGKFVTDSRYIIRDADVTSYYPSIMISLNICPKHLNKEMFIGLLKSLTEERIQAKKSGDKIKASALKIVINSIFGKLGFEMFWLYDPKAFLSVTLSGQLFLLMLIERLTMAGIVVVSANTDGIVCKINKQLESAYYEVCKGWEKDTGFGLEYTDYEMYVRSDVNNYITKKHGNETKEKGRYDKELNLKKAFRYPVVPRCLYNFYVHGKTVEQTLDECKDVLDFCISQKCGGDFYFEFRKDNEVTKLQKTNRFYITSEGEGGKLVKVNSKTGGEIGLFVENDIVILNDYDSTIDFSEYDINYDFYEAEANKYISEIENSDIDWTLKPEDVADSDRELEELPENKDIKITPPRFGFAKDMYYYSHSENVIHRGIGNVKFVNEYCANKLYEMGQEEYESFVDFLVQVKENTHINKRQLEILTTINYFERFGKNKKLLAVLKEFDDTYKTTYVEATKAKRIEHLKEFEKNVPNERMPIKYQLDYEKEMLGRIDSTFEMEWNYVYIESLNTTFAPRSEMYCITNGVTKTIKTKRKNFNMDKFKEGDILYLKKVTTEGAWKKVAGEWVQSETEKVTWCNDYKIIRGI